jgi:CheY-like chemotaxis protein
MREIRKVPGIEQLPIIALTAKTGDEERERCVDAGASVYVSKPVSTRDLLGVLYESLPVQEAASSGAALNVLESASKT